MMLSGCLPVEQRLGELAKVLADPLDVEMLAWSRFHR